MPQITPVPKTTTRARRDPRKVSPIALKRLSTMLVVLLTGVGLAGGLAGCGQRTGTPAIQRFEYSRVVMGIQGRITVYTTNEEVAKSVTRDAFDEIDRLEAILSDYRVDSEVMDLSRSAGTGPRAVSHDLFDILKASIDFSRRSGGAFDVTMGPVVRLWRNARRDGVRPTDDDIRHALDRCGWTFIQLGPPWLRTVELQRAGMQLDFGGIGKGWAADAAAAVLRQRNVSQYLIDLGGDLVLGDPPPDAEGWRIQIQEHDAPTPGLAPESEDPAATSDPPVLILSNSAVAMSGDLAQYVEIDGVRYSHIVDPRTGMGLTNRLEVTIIARAGYEADALASAVSVLGPDAGLDLLDAYPGAVGRVTSLEGATPVTVSSPGFPSIE